MPKVVAHRLIVAMPKGGCGKTATSVAFAWGLHRSGRRVLLIDLDPQGNATAAMGLERGRYGTREFLLAPDIPFAPLVLAPTLHVVPASPWTAAIDLDLERANKITGPVAVRDAIGRVERVYDAVLCDCPPSLNSVTYNAIASGPVLAPVETTRLAVSVLPDLLRVVEQVRRGVAPEAAILAVLPTRFVAEQRESREALRALRAIGGGRVLCAAVPMATAIARSLAEARSPYDPRYRSSKGPPAYLAALREVLSLLEARHGNDGSVQDLDRREAGKGGRCVRKDGRAPRRAGGRARA